MLRKLYSTVSGACCVDSPDSPQHQEVLLPGTLYGMIIKERMDEILNNIRFGIITDVRNGVPVDFNDSQLNFYCVVSSNVPFFLNPEKYFNKIVAKVNFDIGAKLSNFLATGNLLSPTGLDLQQASGFTIIAEKLNWQRFISHFRCIHRGAFFAELKTTAVRKLLPESWGELSALSFPSCDTDLCLVEVLYVLSTLPMALPVVSSTTFPEVVESSRVLCL